MTQRKKIPDLVRRQRALMATQQRFARLNFKLGKADCIKLVRFHLVKMGHRGLPKPAPYSSPAGAVAALKAAIRKTGAVPSIDEGPLMEQLFDALLPRIAPASMLPGDIGLVMAQSGEPGWKIGTAVISVGHKFLAWHPDCPLLVNVEPNVNAPYVAAWRA